MSTGFGGQGKENRAGKDAKITLNIDEVSKLTKEYKKIKKYMKSPMYDLLKMVGKEKIVTNLVKELEQTKDDAS